MAPRLTAKDVEHLSKGKRGSGMKRLKLFSDVFPWLLVPVLIYGVMALFADRVGPDGTPGIRATLDAAAIRVPMLSDVTMFLSWGDLFIVFAVIFLFIEMVKATNTASPTIINHILSMVLFVICLMQFLMFASFATGTFFIITSLVLLDALAGMVVTIISARRDFGVEGIGT